jgi:sugar lactone lactonase YvrE
MLDKLLIRCKVCGQSGLTRGNFDDHVEKVCLKLEVSCLLANINCSWTGQRDQLREHLRTCAAMKSLQPVVDPFVMENRKLKTQIDECQSEIHQLKIQVGQLQTQNNRRENEIQQLKNKETAFKVQVVEQQHEVHQLQEQITQLRAHHPQQVNVLSNRFSRKYLSIFIRTKPTLLKNNYPISEFIIRVCFILAPVKINPKLDCNGVTVAGSNNRGRGCNQLYTPHGFYVDHNENMYIADCYNHRIVEWKLGEVSGEVIVGKTGQGNLHDQLNYPTDVIVNQKDHSLLICDRANSRILRWSRQRGTTEQTILRNIDCFGLAIDNDGWLYFSSYNSHEVRRWRDGQTAETLVAGGNGQGHRTNQLSFPTYIYIDNEDSLYISDSYNHRVVKWAKGAKEGRIVAGGHGEGSNLTHLSNPHGVIVDQSGSVYVADCKNHRIVCWHKNATQGILVVGGHGSGKRPNQLCNPMQLSLDRRGNLYVVDGDNHRIQRFSCQSRC